MALTSRSKKMTIWGNHSADACTPTYRFANAEVAGQNAAATISTIEAWNCEETFIPTVGRSAVLPLLQPVGVSSAASAANAAIDHIRDWVLGTPEGNWVTMGIPSDGSVWHSCGRGVWLSCHLQGR
jgi:malate dehydrogenase